jgi:hypothetical protein
VFDCVPEEVLQKQPKAVGICLDLGGVLDPERRLRLGDRQPRALGDRFEIGPADVVELPPRAREGDDVFDQLLRVIENGRGPVEPFLVLLSARYSNEL